MILKLIPVTVLLWSATASAHKYHDYRWEKFPVVWYLDDSGYAGGSISTEQLVKVFEEAFATWARVRFGNTCTRIWTQYGGLVKAPGPQQDNRNVLSFLPDPRYPGSSRSFALTVPRYKDGRLYEVDIVFHARPDAPFALNPGAGQYDLQSIALHELGHFFGLDHTDVPAATMYGTFPPAGDTSWRTLEPDDRQGITSLYPRPCGTSCTPDGGQCRAAEICHPQTDRCVDNPQCLEQLPPQSGCSFARSGPRAVMVWLVALALVALGSRQRWSR